VVKRLRPKNIRRFGVKGFWVKITKRPCCPIETVVLNIIKRNDIADDINKYLNPVITRWYANQSILYCCGYLFYRPPRTRKTSLIFVLTGVFGLNIYVVSLQEPTLTKEDLSLLFIYLLARYIVLLKDIDIIGLIKELTENNKKIALVVRD
jgi:chaperone BCS1